MIPLLREILIRFQVSGRYYALDGACPVQFFNSAAVEVIWLHIGLAGYRSIWPHGWYEGVRSVRRGFGGGRCGGAAPAQGRAEGPTAQMNVMNGSEGVLVGGKQLSGDGYCTDEDAFALLAVGVGEVEVRVGQQRRFLVQSKQGGVGAGVLAPFSWLDHDHSRLPFKSCRVRCSADVQTGPAV